MLRFKYYVYYEKNALHRKSTKYPVLLMLKFKDIDALLFRTILVF